MSCGGKTAANSQIMYVIVTELWFYKYIHTAPLLCFMYIWWKTCTIRVEVHFFHTKTSTCTTTDHFRSFSPVCLLNCQHCHGCMCLIFFSLPLSCPCKMASTWLCHHHKAANHPACACMFSHVWRALVRIPMWGRISLAARLILASLLLCGNVWERLGWAGGLHAGLMVTKSHQ